MERTVKLTLKDKNGQAKDHIIDFVPFAKRMEYIRMETELTERKDVNDNEIVTTPVEYERLQTDFVAGLFGIKAKELEDGLDTLDKNLIYEIIRYRVLGYSREEDEAAKKASVDEILAGLNTTPSK